MSEDINNNNEQEDLDNIVTLTSENGDDIEFEFLDLIELDGESYVVLLPTDDSEHSEEVVILKLENTDSEDEESYVTVDDDEILSKVFEIFKDKFKDEFDFSD